MLKHFFFRGYHFEQRKIMELYKLVRDDVLKVVSYTDKKNLSIPYVKLMLQILRAIQLLNATVLDEICGLCDIAGIEYVFFKKL